MIVHTAESVLASRMFEAHHAHAALEEETCNALLAACGADPFNVDTWPCDDVWYDWYDNSFEFGGCKDDWCPTVEQVDACLALGFSRCWFNYNDSTERTGSKGNVSKRTANSGPRIGNGEKAQIARLATALAEARNALERVTGSDAVTLASQNVALHRELERIMSAFYGGAVTDEECRAIPFPPDYAHREGSEQVPTPPNDVQTERGEG